MATEIADVIKQKKFTTFKQAKYYFQLKHPDVAVGDIREAFNSIHTNRYVKKYNKLLMGNKFSAIPNIYQMDIYFTERDKTPYLLLVNINTRYAWIHKLKSKDTDEVLKAFSLFVKEFHPYGIECDAEKAFTSYRFLDYLQDNNIKQKVSLNSLHSDLSVINRLSRTLRAMTIDDAHPDLSHYIKQYNKRYHSSIDMAPRDMQFNSNNELRYIYNQLEERDEKDKLLLRENKIEKHDKVRYILDESDKRFHKNKYRYMLSKYYYIVEHIHSPYLYDIVARDGSVKTVPRYRLYKLDKKDSRIAFAPSVENESNFMIYDEITDYNPVMKRDGSLNIHKSKYTVRVITRDERGRKIKRYLLLGIMEVRIARPTDISKLEREFYEKHKDRYRLDSSNYLIPKK